MSPADGRSTRRRFAVLIGLGAGAVLTQIAIATLPRLRGPALLPFLALYSLAFVLYLLAIAVVWTGVDTSGRTVLVIGLVALAMRAVHWGTFPSLSDDVFRYLWDGHLITNGVSPYAFRVDSPTLDALAIPTRNLVNNTWMASPYLPVAQALFGTLALVAPGSILAMQVAISLLDIGTGALIALSLHRLGQRPVLALLYLWHPLLAVEFGHSAHVDGLMLLLTLAGLYSLLVADDDKRLVYWAAPIFLGAATLVKPLPLFLAPILLWRLGVRRSAVWGGVVVALSAPFVALNGLGATGPMDGTGLLGATRIYANQWNYNGGLYHWLEAVTTGQRVPWGLPYDTPGAQTARVISGLAFLGLLAWLGWQARKADIPALLRLGLLAFGGYLLLTTTVHPWYTSVLVAFVPLVVTRHESGQFDVWPVLPWMWLTYAVVWSYLTYVGEFRELTFVRNLEYLPTLGLLAASLFARRYRGQRRLQLDEAQPVAGHGP